MEKTREAYAIRINEMIKRQYNAHYVTCGQCGAIHNENSETLERKYEDKYDYKFLYYVCCYCKTELNPSDCPDLFF